MSQFPFQGQQQFHQQFQQDENSFSFEFGDSPSIFGWIYYAVLTAIFGIGFLLFFSFTAIASLSVMYPNLAVFIGVFVIFVIIFSPSICNCCGKKIQKETVKKVKPRFGDEEKKKIIESFIEEDNEKLPYFGEEMMEKGRICIICLTEESAENCAILQKKYRKDPFHFCLARNLNDDVGSYSEDEERVALALFGCGLRWTLLCVGNREEQEGEQEEEEGEEEVEGGNAVHATHASNNDYDNNKEKKENKENKLSYLDAWLTRILDSKVLWIRSEDEPIPLPDLRTLDREDKSTDINS